VVHSAITRAHTERALAMSRQSLEDARRSVLSLRASPLEKPLPEALQALARGFTSDTGVRVRVQTTDAVVLPAAQEADLYRIAQEALNNVRRHAHAREVEIELSRTARNVRLSIRDDGAGFDATSVPEGRHGILGMKERAKLLHGRFRIRSVPGSGSTITVTAPVYSMNDP